MSYETIPHTFTQVAKILADGGPLYVRNKSRHRTTGNMSILVIDYPSAEGPRSFNMPRTSIPFNLCDQIDAASLIQSSSFRRLFNNGAIEVVLPSEAEALMADPMIRESLRKSIYECDNKTIYNARESEIKANEMANAALRQEREAMNGAAMAPMLAAMDPKVAALFKNPDAVSAAQQQQRETPPPPSSSRFTNLESRVNTGGMAPDAIISELLTMYGDLTEADLVSVMNGPSWPVEAKSWARDRIAFRQQAIAKAAQGATQAGA